MKAGHPEGRPEIRSLRSTVSWLIVALLVLCGYLLYQAISERRGLLNTLDAQEESLQRAEKMSAQFHGIIRDVARLAEQGDVGAKEIIENMQRQGVSTR
jgi:hypothetical protein